jgi:hypothetical protein
MLGALAAATVAVFVGISLGSATALPTVVRSSTACASSGSVSTWPRSSASRRSRSSPGSPWRLLPGRPAIAGALCGLGAGLLTDAGVRLFCWVTEPLHVLVAHGGAIAALVVLGALLATGIDRIAAAHAARRAAR